MSRTKENIPLNASLRSDGPLHPPAKSFTGDEFFTDSILDATRLSSRIPTPSPQKPSLTKARRARTLKTARNAQQPSHRPTASEHVSARSRNKSLQPTTPLRNGSGPTRLRTTSLSTPPGSRGEPLLQSPYSSISSPPPQDLTDTYRQIDDEEDLAQTERELSSDESNSSQPGFAQQLRQKHRSQSDSPLKIPPTFTIPSSASTPTRSFSSIQREKRLSDRGETLSEASGMSFLQNLTDRRLAEAMTPHMSERARDLAGFRQSYAGEKPVAFSRARIPRRIDSLDMPSLPEPVTSTATSKISAFSKATRPPPSQIFPSNQTYGHDARPASQRSETSSQSHYPDTQQNDDRPQKSLPINHRVDRNFHFSTNFGFQQSRPALTEKNLEQQNRGSPNVNQPLRSQSSIPSLPSDQSTNDAKVLGHGMQLTNGSNNRLPQFRKSTNLEEKPIIDEPSQVDWAAAAADIPIPSVENSFDSEKRDSTPTAISKIFSPDKDRHWDNDFTGRSFQVSESPVVRQRSVSQEPNRDKEIQGLAKQALTTSRLSEIRERQSQESLRSLSKSPAPRSTSRSLESRSRPEIILADESELPGELVPDTPVVIYRSSSNSGSDKVAVPIALERPNVDRSKSHDHLQRLARAISTTPRSSPASASGSKDTEEKQSQLARETVDEIEKNEDIKFPLNSAPTNSQKPAIGAVAQTPKVVGAWTDTILPDTVKTVKQANKINGYVQTPHVSAGGWVDTPAPIEQRKFSGKIPTIIEEVPEELTSGIVKDTASSDTIKVEVPVNTEVVVLSQAKSQPQDQPKSALASILDQQKQRLVSQDITATTKEDTLNLGNDTIESLQDLLALDENDITTLSRLSVIDDDTKPLGEIQAESELLERLGIKLDRLRNNIHDARKGISKLEYQVSQPLEHTITTVPQQPMSSMICTVCQQETFQPHIHPESTSAKIPHTFLKFSLPIPLLFYPRTSDQRVPRPTVLGAITLAIWTWYIVENIMCELHCRPAYTDFYVWPTEPEPEFPFVLPTMLARWTRVNNLAIGSLFVWLANLVARLARAVWRVTGMSLGWSDGFASDGAAATQIVKSVVKTVTNVAATATGVDLGMGTDMNDDEYI